MVEQIHLILSPSLKTCARIFLYLLQNKWHIVCDLPITSKVPTLLLPRANRPAHPLSLPADRLDTYQLVETLFLFFSNEGKIVPPLHLHMSLYSQNSVSI